MIIGIESYCGDKLLVGKTLTFEELKPQLMKYLKSTMKRIL